MGFIERLEQEEAIKAQQKSAQQETRERDRLQREANERERRAQRKQLAEKFREESKVGEVVEALGRFLAKPTIAYLTGGYRDGSWEEKTEHKGRGSSSGPVSEIDLPVSRKDPDSVFDVARWDEVYLNGKTVVRFLSEANHRSEAYLAAESCPDGTIVFHGNCLGSTMIRATEWRSKEKEQIFDKALEKAFRHPGCHKRPFEGYKLINQNTFG